jgi:hypothetical protein
MNYLELLRWHNYRKCPYAGKCRKRFDDGIIQTKVESGRLTSWYPNGEFLFHYQDTHGFPHEMMIEEFEKMINSEMTQREIDIYNLITNNHAPVPAGGRSFFEDMKPTNRSSSERH